MAGTIGAAGNNQIGVTGVAWRVKVMSLKPIGVSTGSTADAVKAINYVMDQKKRGVNVRVINSSWGGTNSSATLKSAIVSAGNAGFFSYARQATAATTRAETTLLMLLITRRRGARKSLLSSRLLLWITQTARRIFQTTGTTLCRLARRA